MEDLFKGKAKEYIETKATEIDPVIEEIKGMLKQSIPVRGKQEQIYTQERGQRMAKALEVRKKVGGLAGFYAEKAQFKGKCRGFNLNRLWKNLLQIR